MSNSSLRAVSWLVITLSQWNEREEGLGLSVITVPWFLELRSLVVAWGFEKDAGIALENFASLAEALISHSDGRGAGGMMHR